MRFTLTAALAMLVWWCVVAVVGVPLLLERREQSRARATRAMLDSVRHACLSPGMHWDGFETPSRRIHGRSNLALPPAWVDCDGRLVDAWGRPISCQVIQWNGRLILELASIGANAVSRHDDIRVWIER